MDEVKVEVFDIFEHFISSLDNSINGLYEISLNGDRAIIFRNGDSWGVLSHLLREPVTKCMSFMREDRADIIEQAIEKYLKDNK